ETTDASIIEMAGRQTQEGSWTAFGHRPPLEYSRVAATALAVRAMQLYCPPGLKSQFDRRISRARDWLVPAAPVRDTEHVFRLLGLAWTSADMTLIEGEVDALRKEQRDDGGWAQEAELESDAYATGLTLYALHNGGGMGPGDVCYQKGVACLLKTQHDD